MNLRLSGRTVTGHNRDSEDQEIAMAPPTTPLFTPEMLADPYPAYHQLRAADPVHWHEPFGA
jgi:cytochrome P450